jgi:N utilization substance protein B
MSHDTPLKNMPAARRKARKMALQALYQWQVAETPVHELLAQFAVDQDLSKIDREYFSEVVRGVTTNKSDLDATLETCIDREIAKMTPIELTILRMGAFELSHRIDVPYRVVINEGVELAKAFGAADGHKYVNGVLDKLSKQLRATEINHR